MILETMEHVENTRVKLGWLEERYRVNAEMPGEMTYARRLTMRSLKRLINQLIEEIVRYESRAKSAAKANGKGATQEPSQSAQAASSVDREPVVG